MNDNQTYIALLRGINVGGHHKVPMADLRNEMKKIGFKNVRTLLNSGNVIFEYNSSGTAKLERTIATHLEEKFEFPIPVLIRKEEEILELINAKPFEGIEVTDAIRLYATFLKKQPDLSLALPWISEDRSFRIIEIRDRTVCSVLDLSSTTTPKGMNSLEDFFGSDITTRNWNTIHRIVKKLN